MGNKVELVWNPKPKSLTTEIGKVPDLILGEAKVAADADASLGNAEFLFKADASADISCFNSADDVDDDGILLAKDSTGPGNGAKAETAKLPPQLKLTTDAAWLKYKAQAKIRASTGSLESQGWNIGADRQVVFIDYRRHGARGQLLADALAADAVTLVATTNTAGLRLPTDISSINKLAPGDALAFQALGNLKAKVELSWSDVLADNLGAVVELVKTDVPILIKISAGLKVTGELSISDEFKVIFTRPDNGKVRVAVKRAKSRGAAVKTGFGLTVALSDSAATKEALEAVVGGLFGSSTAKIDALLAKGSLEDLTDPEKLIFDEASLRLGLNPLLADLEKVREGWAEKKKAVQERIEFLAKLKIEGGFLFEYRRTSLDQVILQAVLSDADLATHHESLLKRNLSPLLTFLQANPAALESYLHQKVFTQSWSLGFSLSFGKWAIFSKDSRSLTAVENLNQAGGSQIAYLGTRGYKDKLINGHGWVTEFRAEMQEYSGSPKLADFDLGLSILWNREEANFKKGEEKEIYDSLLLFGWPPDSGDEKLIASTFQGQKKVELVFGLKLEETKEVTTRHFLSHLRTTSSDFARALAAALPWRDDPSERSTFARRTEIYSSVWLACLENEALRFGNLSESELSNLVRQKLRATSPALAFYESKKPGGGATFVEILKNHMGIYGAIEGFQQGLASLLSSPDSPPGDLIRNSFKGMSRFWNQGLFARAFAYMLLQAEREVQVTYPKYQLGRVFKATIAGEDLILASAHSTL